MKKILLVLVILIVTVSSASALQATDFLLLTPIAVKTVLPLYYIPEAFADTDSLIITAAMLMLFTVPNGFLMYNVVTENKEDTKLLRNITKITDGTSGLLMAGYGAYLFIGAANTGTGFDELVGAAFIVFSVPVFVSCLLDFIPYSFERTKK